MQHCYVTVIIGHVDYDFNVTEMGSNRTIYREMMEKGTVNPVNRELGFYSNQVTRKAYILRKGKRHGNWWDGKWGCSCGTN